MNSVDCLNCTAKSCRTSGADCFDLRDTSLAVYADPKVQSITAAASALVDDGRAGTLSRMEELVEFFRSQGYGRIGLAYCFSLEDVAASVRDIFTAAGFNCIPARCSMGGIAEKDINPSLKGCSVGCNPAGQAAFLNEQSDIVVELGICLGHDIILHRELQVPFTVLLVKDRRFGHNVLDGIRSAAERL